MALLGSKEREFCGNGLESNKDRRSRWYLLVYLIKLEQLASKGVFPLILAHMSFLSQGQ